MNLKNKHVGSSTWPVEITLETLVVLAKSRLGARYVGVVKATYGGGTQIEVRSLKSGYHGRTMRREACYDIV